MRTTEERVSTLEHVLEEFIIHTDTSLNRLVGGLEDFKNEMSDFKNEILVFKDEMSDFKNEMSDFKNEMSGFKGEMSGFKDRMEASHKEMNKQWAALAQKMGTLDEDLVFPAVRPVVSKYFKCDPIDRSIRNLRRKNGDSFEVDVLAICEDKVFMIEVRSTPRVNYVDEILNKVPLFKKFFPEYEDKKIIPIFASITFPDNIVQYATRKCLYVMAYREWEYMDIINFDEIGES